MEERRKTQEKKKSDSEINPGGFQSPEVINEAQICAKTTTAIIPLLNLTRQLEQLLNPLDWSRVFICPSVESRKRVCGGGGGESVRRLMDRNEKSKG